MLTCSKSSIEKQDDRSYYTHMNKRENKKEVILLAGMEVMKAKGYNGTSVKDIVDAAGVPKGSFYNYFASKEQFALDAIDYAAGEFRDLSQRVLKDSGRCPLERIKDYFRNGISCACEDQFKVGCFLGNLCQEMSDASDPIRQRLDQILSRNSKLIADVIAEGQVSGAVSSEMDADMAAEFIFNAWEGALLRAKAAKNRAPLDAFLTMLNRCLGVRERA